MDNTSVTLESFKDVFRPEMEGAELKKYFWPADRYAINEARGENRIWTVIDDNNWRYLQPGFYRVDAVYYVMASYPWRDAMHPVIELTESSTEWKPDNLWAVHPDYDLEDWRQEVRDHNTRQGYIAWVNHRIGTEDVEGDDLSETEDDE